MRRWAAITAASGIAFALASAASGCDSFEEGDAPTNDAASEPTTPGSSDGGTTTDGDPVDAEPSFCLLHAGSPFCDDFEQPGRDLAAADPWTMSTTAGPQVRSLARGNGSPNALNVAGAMVEPNETRLSKLFPVVMQKTRISMEVKIDKLAKTKTDAGGIPHFGVAGLVFSDGREMVLFLNASQTGQISGFVYSRFTTDAGGDNKDFVPSAVPPTVGGGFFRLAVEFEPNAGGTDQFRFYLGAAPAAALTLNLNPPAGDSAIVVGARGGSLASDVDVTIDNVLVESF